MGKLAASQPINAPQPSSRTFFLPSHQPNAKASDAVHFDGVTQQLIVCSQSKADSCQAFETTATIALPLLQRGRAEVLLYSAQSRFKVCSLLGTTPSATLRCRPAALQAIRASMLAVPGGNIDLPNGGGVMLKFGPLGDDVDCSYRNDTLTCSSAQPLREKTNSLVFGRFTKASAKLQALELTGPSPRVCDVGGGCVAAEGLALLQSAQSIGAGQLTNRKHGTTIVGMAGALKVACLPAAATSSAAGFHCESVYSDKTSPGTRAYVVNASKDGKRQQVAFSVRNAATGGLLGRAATQPELSSLQDDQTAMRGLVSSVAAAANPIAVSGGNTGLQSAQNTLVPDDEEDKGIDYYNAMQLELTLGGNSWSIWSDAYGLWTWDWDLNSRKPKQECMQQCDWDYNSRQDFCALAAGVFLASGVVGVGATLVLTGGTVAPGVPAVVAELLTASTTAYGICMGAVAGMRLTCYRRCGY